MVGGKAGLGATCATCNADGSMTLMTQAAMCSASCLRDVQPDSHAVLQVPVANCGLCVLPTDRRGTPARLVRWIRPPPTASLPPWSTKSRLSMATTGAT